jgi:hypothetical protein
MLIIEEAFLNKILQALSPQVTNHKLRVRYLAGTEGLIVVIIGGIILLQPSDHLILGRGPPSIIAYLGADDVILVA